MRGSVFNRFGSFQQYYFLLAIVKSYSYTMSINTVLIYFFFLLLLKSLFLPFLND